MEHLPVGSEAKESNRLLKMTLSGNDKQIEWFSDKSDRDAIGAVSGMNSQYVYRSIYYTIMYKVIRIHTNKSVYCKRPRHICILYIYVYIYLPSQIIRKINNT